jgi:hypothetical protein
MALHALKRLVLADKRQFRFRMVKRRRRFPAVRRVACLAFCADCPLVSLDVTRNAPLLEPKKRLVGMLTQHLLDFGRSDELLQVTLFTFERSMFAGENKSCPRMIPMRLVELSELRILPKMLLVTTDACTLHVDKVKPSPRVELLSDLAVTFQTLCAADPLAAFMALGAVGNSSPGEI